MSHGGAFLGGGNLQFILSGRKHCQLNEKEAIFLLLGGPNLDLKWKGFASQPDLIAEQSPLLVGRKDEDSTISPLKV